MRVACRLARLRADRDRLDPTAHVHTVHAHTESRPGATVAVLCLGSASAVVAIGAGRDWWESQLNERIKAI